MDRGNFEVKDEAWSSFTRRLRSWFDPRKELTLTGCIKKALGASQKITIGENVYVTDYPVCLGLLVVSILPLTDETTEFVNAADYYKRAAAFMTQYGLPAVIAQNQTDNWNEAWQEVAHWSTGKKHGAWGLFRLNVAFSGYKYVGKPFSQCLIPPRALRDLPKAFVRAGWVPYQLLTEESWRSLLSSHCHDLGFRQAALKTLLTPDGLSYAIPVLQERFDRWDGSAQTAATATLVVGASKQSSHREQVSKEDTSARFYLTFDDLEATDGQFRWQFRVRASQPLPDVLYLNGQMFAGLFGGWSAAVAGSFLEGLQGYDALNKWRVKWPEASIRLFDRGQWHGLSSRVWVEVNELSRINRMWAICQPNQKERLRQWGQTFGPGHFGECLPDDDFDGTNWPAGYGLFWFERPTRGIPGTAYTLPTTRQLAWVGGLSLSFGIYDSHHRPQLQIVHGDGTETVTAFTELGQQITLAPAADNPTLFSLVGDLPQHTPICCKLNGNEAVLMGQFTQVDKLDQLQTFSTLPARDPFGDVVAAERGETAFTGLTVAGTPENRLHFINMNRHVFYPAMDVSKPRYKHSEAVWSTGDDLLTHLTHWREGNAFHFFDAYDWLMSNAVVRQQVIAPANVSRFKRWALGWYDTLGHLDYDYRAGRIRMLPPTLLPVPCQRGHRAILVGGRSPELLAQLRQAAQVAGVRLGLEAQPDPTYLAPSVISLYSDDAFNGKAHSPIHRIAAQVGIAFLADELPPWRLLERSGSLIDYRATLQPEPEAQTATWTLRVFDPATLRFERATAQATDQLFTLVERQLNAYEYMHYLWIDGRSYRVDKNWGRFLVLHQRGQQVIFRRERHNQIAVPATLPLPRVLARGFALLSGKIPIREEHDFDGTKRAYLLYDNAGNMLSGNYIQKLGQQLQSTNR